MLMDKHLNIKHIPPKSPKNKYILLCCMFFIVFLSTYYIIYICTKNQTNKDMTACEMKG